MPGFAVGEFFNTNANNQLAPSQVDYYYSYTWYVPIVFGDIIKRKPGVSSLIYLKDASLPTFTTSVDKYSGGSIEYKHAKSVNWEDIRLSWYDTAGLLAVVKQWRSLVWDSEYGLRPAGEYKYSTELVSYLPDGTKEQSWLLYNSWPSSIKYGDLTYSNSDIKVVEVTVTYDWADETPAK